MNTSHINMTMLRALVSLGETGSFSRTAEQLCLTQSAVSHAIRGLEDAIGARLILRQKKRIAWTAAGELALTAARTALDAVAVVARVGTRSLTGKLTLASVVSASTAILPAALASLRIQQPGLEISLLVGADAEVDGWVDEGVAAVGLGYDIRSEKAEPLLTDQFYAIGPRTGGDGRLPITLAGFDGHEFVMSGAGCGPLLEALFGRAGVTPRIVSTVSDMRALFTLVGGGYGVSIVPGLAFPPRWRDCVTRRPLEPPEPQPLLMAVNKLGHHEEAVRVVTAAVQDAAMRVVAE